MRIKCGHCHRHHETKREVWFCASGPRAYAAQNVKAAPPQPRPTDWQFKTPRAMVEAIRDGRYCVDVENDFEFIWADRPKRGKKKGCLVIKTQHSENYKHLLTIYPSGSVWFDQMHRIKRLDMAVMMIAADPYTSAMNYGRIKEICSRCGRDLTDNRSIYYGIGPECEKHWPEIITFVNETKGVFVS